MPANFENIVLVDVDTDGVDEVIVIDVSESLKEKFRGRGSSVHRDGKSFPFVRIDDDDDELDGSRDSDGASSNGNQAFDSMHRHLSKDGGSSSGSLCRKVNGFKFSKCKRVYSKEAAVRNGYGLYSESDCDSSPGGSSDYDIMEGTSEEWEKASAKRKTNFRSCHSNVSKASPSCSSSDAVPHAKVENRSKQHFGTHNCCNSGNPNLDGVTSSLFQECDQKVEPESSSSDELKSMEDGSYAGHTGATGADYPSSNCKESENPVTLKDFRIMKQRSNNSPLEIVFSSSVDNLCPGLEDFLTQRNISSGGTTDGVNHWKTGSQPMVAADTGVHDERSQVNTPSIVIAPVALDIINEREKLKETEGYKRAIEEEWAARQRQLALQAEEARRLRKKRKAETLRILDMEKRQKQRLEEVRETQRKDEENINMKEKIRAEVIKELYKLETTSINMASLLRSLGVEVEGGIHPSSQEVHAAYKRAVLKFHPDRASRTNIRQQVEAEEKFKLISRMKEKFISS